MKRVYLEKLEPGMILAKEIYSPSGQILLSEGVVLNDKYIDRLREFGVIYVFVTNKLTEGQPIPEAVSDATRNETQQAVKNCFNKLVRGDKIDISSISHQVAAVLDDILLHPGVVFELSHIQTHSENTFSHSVNVCTLSLLTGIAMGFNQSQLRDLGIGAILHDVGKTLLEKNVLEKNKLKPEEKLNFEQHPAFGFEVLRHYPELNLLAAHIAFQHHEFFNGEGFPRGLKGHAITEYARIVAYADFYDNLITDYIDRKGLKPWEALRKLKDQIGTQLDPDISQSFLRNIIRYPAGSIVEMKTGEMGIVLRNNRDNLDRPFVRIVVDKDKVPFQDPMDINLVEHDNYKIKKVYSDDDPKLPKVFKWA